MTDPAFVSVIIPVFRDWPRLMLCLNKLAVQTLPAGRFEVVVVNNDPSDPCPFVLPASNMRIIGEARKSSYAARNAGIREAKGEVLAFTDSDCLPDARWLAAGLECLNQGLSDLVGGRIDFVFKNPGSAAELLDASTHMDNERSIKRHSGAVTANLFVKRKVFVAIGLFDRRVQSGGDIEFTQRASSQGFLLRYCIGAVVSHPTRTLKEQVGKAYRTGKGLLRVEQRRPAGLLFKLKMVLLHLLPVTNPARIFKALQRYRKCNTWMFARVVALSVIVNLVKIAGIIASMVLLPFVLSTGRSPKTIQ